jgi:hypothetical protein
MSNYGFERNSESAASHILINRNHLVQIQVNGLAGPAKVFNTV